MEDRVRQVRVRAQQALGQGVGRVRVQRLDVRGDAEGGPDGLDVGAQGGLVAGDGDQVGVGLEQVDAALAGCGDDLGRTARDAAAWEQGRPVRLTGRFQSRNYIKVTETGSVQRTAFEISVTEFLPTEG